MATSASTAKMIPPPVMWAQNHTTVFLTVNLEDCKNPELRFEDDSVYFKGKGGTDKKEYEVTIQLYKEVNKDNVKVKPSDRNIELILEKKSASEAFWPTLTKDSAKKSWIKCDFNKWNDESDSDDNANDKTDMMKDLYSYGGGDNGFNMSGGAPSFDDFSPDSDDEEETDGTDDKKNDIPDLE